MGYYLLKFEVVDGEHGYVHERVAETDNIDKTAEAYISTYFGLGSYKDNNAYWDSDGTRAIRLSSSQEISKEDFYVLMRFIGVIIGWVTPVKE